MSNKIFDPYDEEARLGDVINWVVERGSIGESIACPCCDQTVKVYKRNLNSQMARILLIIYRYFETRQDAAWLHVDDYLKNFAINCRYYSLLEHWKLIEAMQGIRDDGSKRTGFWKITEHGRRFARNEITVKTYFLMYNQAAIGWSAGEISIRESLENGGFNYREILDAIGTARIAHEPRIDF